MVWFIFNGEHNKWFGLALSRKGAVCLIRFMTQIGKGYRMCLSLLIGLGHQLWWADGRPTSREGPNDSCEEENSLNRKCTSRKEIAYLEKNFILNSKRVWIPKIMSRIWYGSARESYRIRPESNPFPAPVEITVILILTCASSTGVFCCTFCWICTTQLKVRAWLLLLQSHQLIVNALDASMG